MRKDTVWTQRHTHADHVETPRGKYWTVSPRQRLCSPQTLWGLVGLPPRIHYLLTQRLQRSGCCQQCRIEI